MPLENVICVVKMMTEMRKVFETGRTLPLAFRLRQLDRFYDMVNENFDDMLSASNKDMRKTKFEGNLWVVRNQC